VSGTDDAIPDELRAIAAERGWPDDLARRIAAARVPLSALRSWPWWLDAERAERQLAFTERLHAGDLRGRQATIADGEALADLFAHAPEQVGEFEITTLRGPDAFAQFKLQENVTLNVLEQERRLIACVSWSRRNVLVQGRRMSVTYGQALRVRDTHRRQGLGDQVRRLPWPQNVNGGHATQYDLMRTQNFAVVGWWEKYDPGFFGSTPRREGEVPGVPVCAWQLPAQPGDEDPAVRPTRRGDLARCAELLDRTHAGQDLYRPRSAEALENVLDEGFWGERPEWWRSVYAWPDHCVLEEGGRVVACAGLWDRGADVRERWRHRESGGERMRSEAALLDWGFEEGAEAAMQRLIRHLLARTHARGRDALTVPVDHQPVLAKGLEALRPVPEERRLRWGLPRPAERPHTDLRYW